MVFTLSSMDDFRCALAEAPDIDEDATSAVKEREEHLTKPAGALGLLEDISAWLAGWQRRYPPNISSPLVCVFAGNHGVAARGVSAYPAEVTSQMVANFEAGGAAVNQLSHVAGADFKVIPIELENPTADFTTGPAMTEHDFIAAVNIGMGSIEPHTDLLAVGEMGIANTTSAAAICHSLFGGTAANWTGPGTGVTGDAHQQKVETVAIALKRHTDVRDPIEILRCLGGRELAAMAGAIVAARYKNVPVLIDGYVAAAAAAALWKTAPTALDHCMMAHVSAEPGHRRLLDEIGMPPLLDLGMRLGEASGAALAINIVKSAVACHNGMSTFDGAGVSEKS